MSDIYGQLADGALHEQITSRRQNLYLLERQAAIYPSGQEPLELGNRIREERRVLTELLAEQQRRLDAPQRSAARQAAVAIPAVSAGLGALGELLRIGPVRSALVAFRTDFQAASEQIAVLSGYKQLHDLFQQLEDCYDLIVNGCRRLPADDMAWDELANAEPELDGIVDELLRVAGQATFAANEALWMRRLERGRGDLRAGIAASDLAQVRRGAARINDDILGRELSRVNSCLVTAARTLRLTTLIRALATVRDSLGGLRLDQQSVRQLAVFDGGLDALEQLNGKLERAIQFHDTFQEIDDELRRVRELIDRDTGELQRAWSDLKPLAERLYDSGAPWVAQLRDNGAALEQALASGEAGRIRRIFLRYRSHASRCFNQIDRDLLALCEELNSVGQPLAAVLRMIA